VMVGAGVSVGKRAVVPSGDVTEGNQRRKKRGKTKGGIFEAATP